MNEILKCAECGARHDPEESCLKQRRWEARNPEKVKEIGRQRMRRWRKEAKRKERGG